MANPVLINTWSANTVGASTGGLPIVTSTGNQMQVGDLLVAFVALFNVATISPPAGWSVGVAQWASTSQPAQKAAVYTKTATAADIGATFTFTDGAVSAFWSGGILCFRGAKQTLDAAGAGSSSATLAIQAPVAAAISIVTPGSTLVFFQTWDTGTATSQPTGFTPAYNIMTSGTVEGSEVDTLANQPAGSTGSITGGTVSGAPCDYQAVLVSIAPANFGGPTPQPPQATQIIQNFSRRVWPVGFWNSRVVSAAKPVGPSAARAVPIAAILRNWSPWLSPIPTWTPSLFNAANPPAIPSPNAVPITAILANFSMKPLRVPGFGTGFNSSFPLAFPTPPAPNIPAIIANFSTRVFPQGFIESWSQGVIIVPQGYPTSPAPNIPQILSNFGPRVLVLPSRFPYETPVIIVPSSPSSGSILPIAQIIRAWVPQRVFPPIGSGSKSSAPAIVPVSSLLAALPIRQILAAWQSPFVVPPGGISPSPFTPIPSFPSAWIPLWLTEPIPAGPPAGPDQAIIIFQERIESVTPSLMVQIYSSSSIIPRSSAVTVTAKVTLPDGINPIPGMLPVLYIYSPGDVLVQQQTMNPTGDKTLFQLPYFIQPTAPTGAWAIQVVSQLDNLALDSGIIENAFQVT